MATGVAVSVQSAGTLPEPGGRGVDDLRQRQLRRLVGVGDRARRVVAGGQDDGAGRRVGGGGAGAGPRRRPCSRPGRRTRPASSARRARPASVIEASPTRPWIVTVPAAVSVQSRGTAVPPDVLTTCFTSVRRGGTAVLTIVQVACWPVAQRDGPVRQPSRRCRTRPRRCSRRDRPTPTACRCRPGPGRR